MADSGGMLKVQPKQSQEQRRPDRDDVLPRTTESGPVPSGPPCSRKTSLSHCSCILEPFFKRTSATCLDSVPQTCPPACKLSRSDSFLSLYVSVLAVCLFVPLKMCFHRKCCVLSNLKKKSKKSFCVFSSQFQRLGETQRVISRQVDVQRADSSDGLLKFTL